jgi:hypothetical protein
MNRHGDHAQIGDLVEVIDPFCNGTGIIKLVLGVQNKQRHVFGCEATEKYLYLEGESEKRKACYTRIVRRAMRK